MAGSAPAKIWQELNPRQQTYLSTIYSADQAREAEHRRAGAAGEWDRRPASVWRLVDAYHEPAVPSLVGYTSLQYQWRAAGIHDQGTGSTMAVLRDKKLITMASRGTLYGVMWQVALTRLGRSVVRAGMGWVAPARPGKLPPGLLRERAVEVLLLLEGARGTKAGYLDWSYSRTIEDKLMRADPPLAARRSGGWGRGYTITNAGREHLQEHHDAYVELYRWLFPEVEAEPESDGLAWPAEADKLLVALEQRCRALVSTDARLREMLAAAEKAAATRPAEPSRPASVPESVADLVAEFHQMDVELAAELHRLEVEHAQRKVELVRSRLEALEPLGPAVARYALGVLAALNAAVEGTDPVAAINAAAGAVDPDPTVLPKPTVVGDVSVDGEAGRLHRLATGKRTRGRPPGKGQLGVSRRLVPGGAEAGPYALAWALAGHLRTQVADGYALRLAHPAPKPLPAPRRPARPRHLLDEIAHRLLAALASADTPERAARQRQNITFESLATVDQVARVVPHGGLVDRSVVRVTRSQRALEKLTGGGLAERVDLMPLRPRFDERKTEWWLLHITAAGREHLVEHEAAYRELYPEHVAQPAAAPAS